MTTSPTNSPTVCIYFMLWTNNPLAWQFVDFCVIHDVYYVGRWQSLLLSHQLVCHQQVPLYQWVALVSSSIPLLLPTNMIVPPNLKFYVRFRWQHLQQPALRCVYISCCDRITHLPDNLLIFVSFMTCTMLAGDKVSYFLTYQHAISKSHCHTSELHKYQTQFLFYFPRTSAFPLI